MANQSLLIQKLMGAEKQAADKVDEAKKQRQKRLKKAKDDAESEIEKFRQEHDNKYQNFESKHLESREMANKIDADMQAQIDEIIKAIETNKEQLLKDIISLVCDIKPTVHVNMIKIEN